QSLDLSSSLVTNFSPLAGLTALTTLNLANDDVTNLSFLTNLRGLVSLDLSSDKLIDISPLGTAGSLTNLSSLYLQQNRLNNISVLTNLPHLSSLDIQFNLLGPNANGTVAALQNQGAYVLYLPQRSPPSIDVRTNWVIGAGTNFLSFTLS